MGNKLFFTWAKRACKSDIEAMSDLCEAIESRFSKIEDAHNLIANQVVSSIKKGLPENIGLVDEALMFIQSKPVIESNLATLQPDMPNVAKVNLGNGYMECVPVTTPQPVRIRPEDMVMVKWSDESELKKMKADEVLIHPLATIEYISPIQPVRREWMVMPDDYKTVWRFDPVRYVAIKTTTDDIAAGDLWLPVLSPDEPAPEAPCEVE